MKKSVHLRTFLCTIGKLCKQSAQFLVYDCFRGDTEKTDSLLKWR
jgi:hypothetical protein